jgi:hypothetical protein
MKSSRKIIRVITELESNVPMTVSASINIRKLTVSSHTTDSSVTHHINPDDGDRHSETLDINSILKRIVARKDFLAKSQKVCTNFPT